MKIRTSVQNEEKVRASVRISNRMTANAPPSDNDMQWTLDAYLAEPPEARKTKEKARAKRLWRSPQDMAALRNIKNKRIAWFKANFAEVAVKSKRNRHKPFDLTFYPCSPHSL